MVVTNYLLTGMILQVERGLTTLLGGENASVIWFIQLILKHFDGIFRVPGWCQWSFVEGGNIKVEANQLIFF